jgi:Cu(I)-responsive transcriptional regulator
MNIGEAAEFSGVSAKMIRYYEETGLVPKPGRTAGGYRSYDHADIHRLKFVARSRELGFSMEKISELLRLWQDRKRSSRDVKNLAQQHLKELEDQIQRLQEMHHTLKHLADACDGNNRPHCPILKELGKDLLRS